MSHDFTYTQNRELSWLKFNQRVLAEALDEQVPLLEKLNFLKIFSSNLDEFFMVRVGRLTDLALVKNTKTDNKSGLTASEQLDFIFQETKGLYQEKDRIYRKVEEEFRQKGIYNLEFEELNKAQKKAVYKYFKEYILPVVSPQLIGFEHPFPFLENKAEYLISKLKKNGKERFAIMALPQMLPKIIQLPSSTSFSFIPCARVISEYAQDCYPNAKILSQSIIRVTRNADLSVDDEVAYDEEDYRSHMKKILKKRNRLQTVRLEADSQEIKEFEDLLCEELNIQAHQIFESQAPLCMDYVSELRTNLSESFIAQNSYQTHLPRLGSKIGLEGDIISKVKNQDFLLSYPYDSMDPFLKLIEQAAEDPRVLSIKISIYRLAKNSRLVQHLCRAAENGKEVFVIMELRARFDEQNNLDYSKKLYDSGCHIIYGMAGYKIHSKICLITIKDRNEWWHITQIGTGNYNEVTAGLYTDFSFLTAHEEIGEDAVQFFKNMAMGNLQGTYKHLLQSPSTLKSRLLEEIEVEIAKGREGYILCKMNSLTDRDFIDKLSQASQAGVQVRMVIRGICCILPGIEGRTENIEVHSIVGRFLEHSRLYVFGKDQPRMYLGSADLMTRNTENRVELLTPIYDKDIQKRLISYLEIQLKDNIKGRKINEQGDFTQIPVGNQAVNSQEYFMQEAYPIKEKSEGKSAIKAIKRILKQVLEKMKN